MTLTREEYRRRYEAILPTVERPTRYIGGEWNETVKHHDDVRVTERLSVGPLNFEGWSSAPGAAVRQARSVESRFRNGRTTADEIITHGHFDVAAAARVRAG